MEDIVYISSQAVAKRKRSEDPDDRTAKRVQLKEESSSHDSGYDESSSDESESDDDAGTAGIGSAMSAARISTEPQAMQKANSLAVSITGGNNAVAVQAMNLPRPQRQDANQGAILIHAYIDELEHALKEGLKGLTELRQLVRPTSIYSLRHYVVRLENLACSNLKFNHPARQTLEHCVYLQSIPGGWTSEHLIPRLTQLRENLKAARAPPARNTNSQILLRDRQDAAAEAAKTTTKERNEGVVATGPETSTVAIMQTEIDNLKAEVAEARRSYQEAIQTNQDRDTRKRKKFTREIKEKNNIIVDLQNTQRGLTLQVQQRDEEIAVLKSRCMADAVGSKGTALKKAEKTAREALKAARTKTTAMFSHYDAIQNKNTILIGKLAMMANVGGFGNPGSAYRKELDTLKAPPLTELEEYVGEEST